eukprot:9848436-Alexandrium_andersonii.AAC.1
MASRVRVEGSPCHVRSSCNRRNATHAPLPPRVCSVVWVGAGGGPPPREGPPWLIAGRFRLELLPPPCFLLA